MDVKGTDRVSFQTEQEWPKDNIADSKKYYDRTVTTKISDSSRYSSDRFEQMLNR